MAKAKLGDTVKIHYTGTLADGSVFDSSTGRAPLSFTIGGNQVIPGFEEAVLGMTPAETKQVTIPAEKAYGLRNETLVFKIPRAQVPPDLSPEPGQRLQMQGPGNEALVVTVTDVTEQHVVLDANPPLAGKDLTFAIELVDIS